jgi:CheY-like chemotaxis protein
MRQDAPVKRGSTARSKPPVRKNSKRPAPAATAAVLPAIPKARPPRSLPREPIYLASQLASICDVDLKTIHNWCDRNDDPEAPALLESFRTPGGHLRFRHSSVLRFLTRWGYPIPDALLRDRPHLLVVEPDQKERENLIRSLGLVRPGEEDERPEERAATVPPLSPTDRRPSADVGGATMGLFCNLRWYVHVWDDPYAALVAVGERAGAGAPLDLAVLSVPMVGLDERAWIRTLRERSATRSLRFVLVTTDERKPAAGEEMGVVGAVPRERPEQLASLLDEQSAQLMALASPERLPANGKSAPPQRKRRGPIAPREPIFVASQVANIWDVDLKTVHNWVERGDIEAFCTPGRHLRFRRRSLLHFLRRYNMAIPEELAPHRPRVLVIDTDARSARKLSGTLNELFEVTTLHDPVAALAEIGAQCAGASLIDAVVVAFPVTGVDDRRWVHALARHPDTRYTRVVVVSLEDAHRKDWQDLGAIATVERQSIEQVAPVLEKALGIGH